MVCRQQSLLIQALFICTALLINPSQARELAQSSFSFPPSLFTGTFTGTGVGTGPFTGSASSCASASASTTGGSATAWSQSNSQSVSAAASACANAATQAFANICASSDAYTEAAAFADACTEAVVKVYVSSVSGAVTNGYSRACASGCSNANAVSSAVASALAKAASTATGGCVAAESNSLVKAASAAMANVTAVAWTAACSTGSGKAFAQSVVMAQTIAQGYASAFGSVLAAACGCGKTCKCKNPVYNAVSNSASLAEVVDGRYALAKTVSDAAAKICPPTGKADNIKVAVESTLTAYADICIRVFAKLVGRAQTLGSGTVACAGGMSTNNARVLAEAYGEIVAGAFSISFQDCAEAAAAVDSAVFTQNAVNVVVKSYQTVCAASGGKVAAITEVNKAIRDTKGFADAVANAFSNVVNKCGCKGMPYCCSTCDWVKTCPAYKA